ncbi:hypothetical protein [Methylogaea oryzae]|nr:hypothetical protein [Methylogaea oryzae]
MNNIHIAHLLPFPDCGKGDGHSQLESPGPAGGLNNSGLAKLTDPTGPDRYTPDSNIIVNWREPYAGAKTA